MIFSMHQYFFNDQLGFHRGPYPMSFISLEWMKNYAYIVTDDVKGRYKTS